VEVEKTMISMKAPKTKKRFVNVIPKSSKAKNRFVNIMQSLHAMEVEQETDTELFLVSINRMYCTWVPKEGNEHWEIAK
jgi:hypothetical protein